jgi:hypothetical protein
MVDKAFPKLEKVYAVQGLREGDYALKVSRRGFRDFETSYSVSRGEEARVYLDLQPKKPTPIIKSWKLWVPVGAVAVAAVVTTAVVLAANKDSPPSDDGYGVVHIGLEGP